MRLQQRDIVIRAALLGAALALLMASPAQSGSPTMLRLDLNGAAELGLQNEYDLKAIRNRRAALRSLITERRRAYLPRVGVSYSRTRDITDTAQDRLNHDVRLNFEQTLYDGGVRSLNLDLARIDALLVNDDYRILRNQIRLAIQKAFLRTLAANGKIRLNGKSLERAQLQLRQARVEEKAGLSTRVQVLTVASRVREIELALQAAHNEYRQSLYTLKTLLNLNFETGIDPVGDIFRDFELKPPTADVERLIAQARNVRPEVKRSQTNVHRLNKEHEIAENSWIPRVSAGGYVGRNGPELPVRERNWGINFTISFPIGSTTANGNAGTGVSSGQSASSSSTSAGVQFLDDLSYDRRVIESKVSLDDALNERRRLNNQIAIDVQRGHDALREAWEAIRIGNGRVYFRHQSLRITDTQMRVGTGKRDDIVFAETELVRAQEDLTDALAAYMQAAYELEFASGIEPGSLGFFLYRPGQGNTLLAKLLEGEKPIPVGPKESRVAPPGKAGPATKTAPGAKGKRPSGYLLDDVKLE